MQAFRFVPRCLGFAALPLIATGCTMGGKIASPSQLATVRSSVSKQELSDLLAQFEDTYEAAIREAAERIVSLNPDRRTRRLSLLWQTRLVPMARDALNQDEAVHSLLDVWALCLRMQHFFEDGDGRTMFGDQQHLAREAADRCVQSVEQVAAKILMPNILTDAREGVDALARQYPLRGEFSGSTIRTAVQRAERGDDVLAAIVTAPLAPFRAFEGIDRGAAAIQGFTAVAARMTDTVHDLPEQTRTQVELLLLEFEELESVQTALASLKEFAQSSSRFSTAAERLPAEMRRELVQAADDLEGRQASLQKSLSEAREVVERIDQALARVESSAAAVERTALHTARAGEAWTGTFQSITDMVDSFRTRGVSEMPDQQEKRAQAPPPPVEQQEGSGESADATGPPTRGFDIKEYTETAEALDRAAVQLLELTRELRSFSSGEMPASLAEFEARFRGIIDQSRNSAVGLADHAAWRGAQLILLVFGLVLVYHLGGRLLASRRAQPQA